MIRHKRTIEQKFKAIVAMIVAMGLVSGFTLQDGTISDAWSLPAPADPEGIHSTHYCSVTENALEEYDGWDYDDDNHWETCSKCNGDSKTTDAVNHDYSGGYYYHDSDNLDYRVCGTCLHVDKVTAGIPCNNKYEEDVPNNKHREICQNCGEVTAWVDHSYTVTPNSGTNTHKNTCACGKSYDSACTMKYVDNQDGSHQKKCAGCGRDEPESCTFDSDGFCSLCEKEAKDAKDAIKALYDLAKTTYGWPDSSDADTNDSWIENLTQAEFDGLYTKYQELYEAKYGPLDALDNPALKAKVDSYIGIHKANLQPGLVVAINKRKMGTLGGSDIEIFIEFHEMGASALSDGTVSLTQGAKSEDYVLGSGKKIGISDTATEMSKNSDGDIILVKNQEVTVTVKAVPAGGYNDLAGGPYKFTPVYSGSDHISMTKVDGIFEENGSDTIKIYFDKYPKFSVDLYKDTTPLASGSIKFAATDDAIYKSGDEVRIGACPTSTKKVEKIGNVIFLKPTVSIAVEKDTVPPAGCEPLDDTGLNFTVGVDGKITAKNPTSDAVLKKKSDNAGIEVYFKSETAKKVDIKFFDKATPTTALTTGTLLLELGTTKVDYNIGDTIVMSNSTSLTKDGTTITVKDGEEITVSTKYLPIGYKDIPAGTYKFTPHYSADNVIVSSTQPTYLDINATNDNEIDVFFDKAPTIKFTKSGDGAPDKTGLIIKEKFGAQRTINVASATSPETQLADGEYSVTTTNAAKGYKNVSGTFKIVSGAVSSNTSDFTGACERKDDATVNIKFTKDDKIPDIKVYKYPKKDGKDEPDTKKDALKSWTYVLEQYDGDETTDEKVVKDKDDWKTVIKEVKPDSGKSYATLDAEKLTVGEYYRFKTGKDTYAYFYLQADGTVKDIKGNIDTNDDGDEVYLWDDDPDEDSDDVIAVHKVNNTGANLSGAHLQIYPYSESNTLAYGSSSTASTNSTNSGTSTNSSASTNSSSSTNTRTTTAKTTPAKPSVSTSDVIVDWTTGEKAQVIDIDKLEKGKNYTLREVSAPSGYETPAYDFVFKYGTDGNLTIVRNYNGLLSVTGNKLVLKNLTPTEAAATRPKTGDHSRLALWLDICIVMLGGLYLSGYSIFEAFTEKKKVKVVAKKKPVNNKRKR